MDKTCKIKFNNILIKDIYIRIQQNGRKMKYKLKKIDAVIIVVMIVIAGFVLNKIGIMPNPEVPEIPDISFFKDEENRVLVVKSVSDKVFWSDMEIEGNCDDSILGGYIKEGDQISECIGTIIISHKPTDTILYTYTFKPAPKFPSFPTLGNLRDVSPEDEGVHFKKLLNIREWWYYTVVFDEDSNLSGWSATIGFMHMAWGDLRLQLKPDILVVTLHSPEGDEYGGLINKQRGEILGILGPKTLEANYPGVDLKFEDSWALGQAPKWHVHAEDNDIDKDHDIIIDLDYFAPSSPMWLHSSRLFDLGEGNIANYIFTGCDVSGKITVDGLEYIVKGIGHHEHSWSLGVTKFLIKGWDWCHIKLDNGWNVYYSKYYLSRQILPTSKSTINPYASILITTDQGETITMLEDVDITIKDSDNIFLLLKIPSEFVITAKPSLSQILLTTYNIRLNLKISSENTYDKIWKFPTFVGMRIGRSTVSGSVQWTNDNGDHEIEFDGIASMWNMRKF